MPNILDANGLQVSSLSEIVGVPGGSTGLIPALEAIYGTDINVGPNTPDGNQINIFAQTIVDMLETLMDCYNIFFVDSAYGVILDQAVALNGITRNQGSFTQVSVEVTFTQAVTLAGMTASIPFTVADDAGNQYELVTTYAAGGAGVVTLLFEAVLLGQVQVLPNTITNISTTTIGVSAVNNPAFTVTKSGTVTSGSPIVTGISTTAGMTKGMDISDASAFFPVGTKVLSVNSTSQITASQNATGGAPTTENITVSTPPTVVGVPEETDVQLKIRRANSFNLQTTGPGQAIRAGLLSLADVTDAYVAENDTASPVDSVPANGVWVIVNGGTASEIGGAVYAKKMPGCAQKGSQSYNVPTPQGGTKLIKWDNAVPVNFYVRATLNPRLAGQTFDLTTDTQELSDALLYKLGQSPSIGDVIQAMALIEPNAVLSTVGVSTDGITYEDIISPSSFQDYFFLPTANITLSES